MLPNSASWAQALEATSAQIGINMRVWTPGIFAASAATPRQRVSLDGGWVIDDVPIPGNLSPSPDSDGHALILDRRRNREYDFFRLSRGADGTWSAAAGVVFRLNGSGWWKPDPWGARASSAALGGGLIRPYEVGAGQVRHALACSAPKWLIRKMSFGTAAPATTSDGWGGTDGFPMGTRFQLDPALDLNTLGLDASDKIIARALQVYGMYVVDSSSTVACFAANAAFYSTTVNPYPAAWNDGLPRTLLGRMRAVAPPRSVAWDSRMVLGQPHRKAR